MGNEIERSKRNELGKVVRSSRDEILDILAGMFAMFQARMEAPTVDGYVLYLQDIPADGLRAAVARCVEDCDFVPTVAHIRKAYAAIREESGEWKAPGSIHLTQEEIARRPLPPTRIYQPTQAERLAQLRKYRRDGDEERGGRRGH